MDIINRSECAKRILLRIDSCEIASLSPARMGMDNFLFRLFSEGLSSIYKIGLLHRIHFLAARIELLSARCGTMTAF